ncbi:MAG TPA: DUF4097 family beta strand repeat-containing protein [Thermoanaerobaculia bacterium]
MNSIRTLSAALALALLVASPLLAATTKTSKFERALPLGMAGVLTVRTTTGSVEVVGVDEGGVRFTAIKTVTAFNTDKEKEKALLAEADRLVELREAVSADGRNALIHTLAPAMSGRGWRVDVRYVVWMPRTADLRVEVVKSQQIRVVNMIGNVSVKNFSGTIVLERVTGVANVESTNGGIVYMPQQRLGGNVTLKTVNGNIEAIVPDGIGFQWAAEALAGDVRSTIPGVRGRLSGPAFRGSVNAPGGPTLTTATVTGNVFLLRAGTQAAAARSLRETIPQAPVPPSQQQPAAATLAASRAGRRDMTQQFVQGRVDFATNIGDISISELRGDATLSTGAGEVRLGTVTGTCRVTSLGGPLELGDIFGLLDARTQAGDVTIQAARSGGSVQTGGGIIRLVYAGGPTSLSSAGGDIIVRQAASSVNAETRSGDISISVDPGAKTQRLGAKTAKGNVVLFLPPRFGADVDITVITTDANATHLIESSFGALSVQREQIAGGKTRLRASGKINGGGERLELFAEGGGVQIKTQPVPGR